MNDKNNFVMRTLLDLHGNVSKNVKQHRAPFMRQNSVESGHFARRTCDGLATLRVSFETCAVKKNYSSRTFCVSLAS